MSAPVRHWFKTPSVAALDVEMQKRTMVLELFAFASPFSRALVSETLLGARVLTSGLINGVLKDLISPKAGLPLVGKAPTWK